MEKQIEGYLDRRSIDQVAGMLQGGGVAVLPTDTIYGFHCVYSDPASLGRIRKLKGRSKSVGFIMLASSLDMADSFVEAWPFGARGILEKLWPAPLTVILPASKIVPSPLRPDGGVALRIPAMPTLIDLIEKTGEPLVSTSANRSGRQPLNRIADIKRTFPGLDAYISRRGPGRRGPSTVISLTEREPHLIRAGWSALPAVEALGIDRHRGKLR
jgi:tRNA threonylcarbamoyl adenosine modification protein (Sua5/YciO/YrdC/YwlC family)